MKYTTKDELQHFSFSEAYIGEVEITSGLFHMGLANVTILPENSCNRDIREMRTNKLTLKLEEFAIMSLVEEGYQVFNPDGKLMRTVEDAVVAQGHQFSVIKGFEEGSIYSLEKQENSYIFLIDAPNGRTYQLKVNASHDVEEWDRFLNRTEEYQ